MQHRVWRDLSVRRRYLQQRRLLGEDGQMPITAECRCVRRKQQSILTPVHHGNDVRSRHANVCSARHESDVSEAPSISPVLEVLKPAQVAKLMHGRMKHFAERYSLWDWRFVKPAIRVARDDAETRIRAQVSELRHGRALGAGLRRYRLGRG